MAVSAQFSSITPQGIKKKRSLWSPYVQEQAAQGLATQMVLNQKEEARYEEEQDYKQEQFDFQKEQQASQEEQWQKDYNLQKEQWQKDYDTAQNQWQTEYDQRMQDIETQKAQWQEQHNLQKKQNLYGNVIGGLSTAASIMSVFDFF